MTAPEKSDAIAVSVIVPVYNMAPYLDDCIASVLAQSLEDFELILVNDGSSDGSEAVCAKAAQRDSRIRLISYPARQGVSYARNRGIEAATGTYLCFLDADDMLHPQLLQFMYEQANASQADMVIADSISPTQEAEQIWHDLCEQPLTSPWTELRGDEVLNNWFTLTYMNVVWPKLYLRDAVGTLRFDEAITHAEDTRFNYQFITAAPRTIAYCDAPGHFRRVRNDSANRTLSFEAFVVTLEVKRSIRDAELACGRHANALVMEREYVRQIRYWLMLPRSRNKSERKQAKALYSEERHEALFKELDLRQKLRVDLMVYTPSINTALRAIKHLFS